MKLFKKYNDFLVENALFIGDYERFDNYLDDIFDNKKTLKNIEIEMNLLISRFKNLDYNKIRFNNAKYRDNENYEIDFSIDIVTLINPISNLIKEIQYQNEDLFCKITNIYFNGNDPNFSYDIQLDRNNFNKFHFPIDLPMIFRNLGLGKKIIKSAINKFNYLLFTKEDDSFELRMTVHSITKMKDVYSFMKGQNILIFKDDFELVKNNLKLFLEPLDNENFTLDEDFLLKYKEDILKDEFLAQIYQKYIIQL